MNEAQISLDKKDVENIVAIEIQKPPVYGKRVLCLPAGTHIRNTPGTTNHILIEALFDYATRKESCPVRYFIPIRFKVKDPMDNGFERWLNRNEISQIAKDIKEWNPDQMDPPPVYEPVQARTPEKGLSFWLFHNDVCVASALTGSKYDPSDYEITEGPYTGYKPPAIENDRNALLTIEYLCSAPLQGYGTSLMASIALFFSDDIELEAIQRAVPFYQKIGMKMIDDMGTFYIAQNKLHKIFKAASKYDDRIAKVETLESFTNYMMDEGDEYIGVNIADFP